MKKLNLNNTIATTAMLTKTNTMKNKMNLFAKVVMLVVMILAGEGTWNVVHADYWHFANERWWALFIQEDFNSEYLVWEARYQGTGNTHYFYLPTGKNSSTEFYATNNKNASYDYTATLTISGNGLQNATCSVTVPGGSSSTQWIFAKPQCTVQYGHNTATATFSKTRNSKTKKYLLGISLPDHVEVKSSVKTSYSKSVDMTNSTIPTDTIQIDFSTYFKSFYTQNGTVTLSIDGGDASCFSIDNSTLINNGSVYASSECWGTEFQGNEKPGTRTITFTPNRVGRHEAILYINYGGSSICDITLTGTCNSAQQVTWTSSLPSPYIFNNGAFSSIDNLSSYLTVKDMFNQTVSSPSAITFTANNGATVSGNKLTFANCSTVTVTATSIGANGNYLATTLNSTTTCQATKVTPVISSFAELDKGCVGTQYDLARKADWAASGQPDRGAWINDDGVVINYTSSNHVIAADGTTFTPQKAGLVTITASIAAANNHNASTNRPTQPLQIDFNQSSTLYTFTQNTKIGEYTTETIDLANFFVPNGSYSATVTSGSEFIVINGTNITDNKISVKFAPTSISEVTASSEVKEANIKITNDGKEYSFKIQATAEKAEANLTVFYSGDTHVFSTITLGNSKSTTAGVTYKINGEAISGNTYKITSVSPITVSATTPANASYMAGNAVLEPFTPEKVTPVLSWNQSDFGDKKVGDADITFNAATWTNTTGEPDASQWEDGEVTIKYTPSNDAITVNGNTIHINKAGVATLKASIEAEKNHNASNTISKTVNIAFADGKTITLNGSDGTGTFVGESSQSSVDLSTEMVKAGDLEPTSTNQYFNVTFSGYTMNVTFSPAIYNNGNITETFTFRDKGTGKEYTLLLSGNTKKHTPVIEWRSDVQTIAIAQDENDIKTEEDLIDATNSQYFQPLKFKSGDVSKVKVCDENYEEVEWGIYVYPVKKGSVTIYAKTEETANHYASTEASEKQFTVIGEAKSKIAWNQNFLRKYNDQGSIPLNAEVQASSNSAPITGATVTYHLLEVQNNVVTLDGCTLKITAGATGTAKIYAEFAGDDDYIGCVSETLNIRVIARPIGGMCEPIHYDDVTLNPTTYYFNKNMTSAGEPYFEVEKVEYYYYVKGDNGEYETLGRGEASSRTITATFGTQTQNATGTGGANAIMSWNRGEGKTDENYYTFNAKSNENPQSISFTGDINKNGSKFTEIKVTPKSYFRENTDFSNPFAGSDTKVDEETTRTLELGKYSNLSEYTIQLWDYELNQAYSGGEFSIIDGGSSDHYPDGCNDYGNWIITVKFKPTSGKPEKVHRCKIQITYKKGIDGSNGNYNGFEIEANASRHTQPDIIWNQDLSGLTSLSTKPTGEDWTSTESIELTAKSGLSEADYYGTNIPVDHYEITAGTDVAEIVNDKYLSIKKAGQFTIKAIHNGDDKYEPTSKERTIDIALSEPTIELSHNGTPIAENETINVTYNDPSITIGGKAMYGDFEIYGYNVGGKIQLSSSVPDVVTIANGNQLQFLKSGDAVITATITEDDVVFGKTFTFNVHVDKAPAGLHWDDESNYTDGWMYVFDTKQMTAVAGNDDNTGEITYEVTSGDADIDANGIITLRKFESITVKAKIAETDKYFADDITISFIPTKVTPVVTWDNTNLTTDKSQTTYTIADNDLATVSAVSQIPTQPSVDKWVDGKEITYSVESDNGVITLQNGHTFTINKAGQATIMAKVIAGGNNNASSNSPTRKLKVDFDPSSPIYCGEAVVFGTCTTTVNLGDIMAIEGNITVSVQNNDEFKAYFHPEDNELIITYSPKSIKEPNPTEAIVAITDGNEVQYKLHVTGKALPYTPIFYVSQTKHDNWVFETTPNKAKSEIIYGYDNSSDIYWSNTDGIAIQEAATELAKVQLSLKDATDAEYVEIVDDGRNFRVKNAKVDSDEDFTVFIVASYPGLKGKMEPSSVEIPITIRKTQYVLNWNAPQVSIYANEQIVEQTKPVLSPLDGVSAVQYSYSKEGVISYDETEEKITLTDEGKKESSVMLIATVASDIYGKGTSASITVTIKKRDQYINWDAIDISDFTTQRDTTLAIDLQAFAQFKDSTKANIFYNVTEVSNCDGEGPLIRIDTIKTTTPYTHKLYYTGNGSGKVTIVATASGTDDFNPVQIGSTDARKEINITKEGCNVNDWTVNNMRYGDKVVLEPTVDKFTRGENYEYTLPPVNGTLDTAGNVLNVKGVGNGLTISAKKLEDCWVNESEGSTASNTFNIAKSEQEIKWNKTVLGTPQEGAYHFGVLDGNAYQLATQAIDTLHKDAAATWLPLEGDKYVTANVSGDAPGGLSLVYSVEEQNDVCKVDEGKIVSVDNEGKMHITGNGTGKVLVIASVDGRDYYENVSETITVVVDKATPTFIWNVPESEWNVTYGEAINPVTVTTEGDGTITLTSTNIDVATIDNNGNITINGAGTTEITATLAEGCKYFAANETLTQTLTVNKAATSFTITKLELTYGDEDMAFSVTNDNGLTEEQYTMTITNIYGVNIRKNANNQTHIDAIHANSENIEVGLKFSHMANYADVETTAVVTVAKCPVEIVWDQDLSIELANQTTINHKEGFALTATIKDTKHNKDVSNETAATFGFTESGTSEGCTPLVEINNYVLSVTGNGAGTVTVTASYAESDNFLAANSVEQSFTITKVDPEVTMETIANVTCGATDTLGATANHGGNEGFTFESSNTDTATVSDSTFTALHAGTVRFRVTKAATCTTNEQTSDYVVATIDKADQTVTWNNSESETLLATDMTNGIVLSATAKSNVTRQPTGTVITYTITEGGDLAQIVEDNRLVSLGAGTGTVTIKATAGTTVNGYEDYNTADTVLTFNVVPDTITFTVAQLDLTYGDEDMAFSVTNDNALTEGQYTMTITNIDNTYLRANAGNANHIDAIHAHSEDIEVDLKFSGMTNYADVETTAVVTVAKCPVEIVWNQDLSTELANQTTISHITGYHPLTATIKDTKHNKDVSSEAAATFGFTVSDTTEGCTPIVTLNGNSLSVTGNGAGTVTVIASYAESDNFLAATSVVEKSFTITKADPQFNWADISDIQATYGDVNLSAGEITKYGDGVVTYSSSEEDVATINPSTGAIALLKQGETIIYADLAATCQYEAGTRISKKLTVGRKERTLSWSTAPSDMIYGSTQTVVATPSEGEGTITYSINDNTHAAINSTTGEITTIGVTTMPITVTATIAQTEQYESASVIGKFIITPASADFEWGNGWSSTVAREMDYQASETLSVVCLTEGYNDYSVTYTAADGDVQYVNIQDDVVTVADVKSTGNVTVKATIHDNNGNYSDVVLTTEIHTNKIDVPNGIFSFNDVTLTYNEGGENLDGYISCSIAEMQYSISDYTISQSGGVTYVSLGGNDNKTLSPVNATNGATVTVTAHITEMTNYNDCDVTGNVTVAKGTQMITWDEDKNYTVSNMAGSINLSDYCTLNVGGGNISFASSDDNIAEVSGNNLVIKQITAQNPVIITATAEETANYKEATESREFTITVETPIITVIGGGTESVPLDLSATEPKINSVTNNVDLAAKLVAEGVLTCNYQNVTYTFVSDNTDIATFNESDKRTIISYKRSDALKLTVTAKVDENHQCSTELWVKIPRGTMIFNRDGNWHDILNDESNWQRRDLLPSADDHNVSIQANCTIDADVLSLPDDDNVSMQVKSTFDNITIAECYNLDIAENGSLTVDANDVLKVEGTFTNSNASKLKLEADENNSATVLFAGGSPDATVENYIKGELHPEGNANNPDWQYRGFVGNNPSLSGVWNVVIFKWNETLNNTNCWGTDPVYTNETVNYSFSPWDGYCMANYDGGHERDYTSKLISTGTGYTYNLSYTNHGQEYPNRGVNLITNSWSAPINMASADVVFSDNNVERTFYFYKTRNHKDWEDDPENTFEVYPQNTGHVTASSTMIASGQSFLVKATGAGATLTINGSAFANVANGAMHAPAEKERFNVLSITMSVDTMADRVFLLESENCSRAFDNGYDGTKIKEGNMPQIFASNDFGHTAVNTDKTMLGQRIGYSAAEDGALCTITFNTDRLDGFSELYLYDRATKRYADILAGDSYSFTGTKAGEEERFEIVGRRDDGSEFVTSSDMMIEVIGNRALLSGFAGGNDEVFITDMNGKRLWTERASNGPWFELPNLPAGVYLINCGEANCKFIVK